MKTATTEPTSRGGKRTGAGRPAADPEKPRNINREITASAQEWQEVAYRARDAGKSVSRYLIESALT